MGRTILTAVLPLAMLASAPAVQAQAQPGSAVSAGKVDAAFYAIYDAVLGGADMEQVAIAGTDSVYDSIGRNDPGFTTFAAGKPALKAQFRAATLPFMRIWMGRSTAHVREEIAVKLSKHFTIDEAREVAQFYASPLGRKVMKSVSANMTFDATIDSAIKSDDPNAGGGIAEKDVDQTIGKAMPGLLGSLTAAERAEMARLEARPAFRKLVGLGALMRDVKQPGMDDISTPQEREGFQKAIMGVFEKAAKGG